MVLRPHPVEPVVFPLEGQQVTMGSGGLAAKMETSELTAIIMCCVRSTPHMGAKLLNSACSHQHSHLPVPRSAEKVIEVKMSGKF